jgi:hypothetical protein
MDHLHIILVIVLVYILLTKIPKKRRIVRTGKKRTRLTKYGLQLAFQGKINRNLVNRLEPGQKGRIITYLKLHGM